MNNWIKNYILLGLLFLLCPKLYSQSNHANTDKPLKRFIVSEDLSLPLHNGIHLSARIVRHEGDTAPLPVILVVSCYPGTYTDVASIKTVLRKGYIGLMVYSRGKAKSEGIFEPFEHEAEDMYDIIEWVSKQPWCNGKIGMCGGSYLGFTQWAACKKLHPALKTIVPLAAVAPGIDFPMQNNVFFSYMLRWIRYTTHSRLNDNISFFDVGYWSELYNRCFKNGIAFNQLDSLDASRDAVFQRWLQHPGYDSYWSSMIPSTPEEYQKINIPILTVTGYFDADQLGAMHYYNMHNRYGTMAAIKKHYLLIGPWDHAGAQSIPSKKIGNYQVDSAALISIYEVAMDWFDYTLKGKEKPSILKDRVNYFIMNGGWKHAATLEKMNTDTLNFYLTDKPAKSFYTLSGTLPGKSKPLKLQFNPADTAYQLSVSETGVNATRPLTSAYLRKQEQIIFETLPFQQDLIVSGSPTASLFIRINKKDIDFNLEFYEVTPDHKSFLLSTIIQRASYMGHRNRRQLINPGEIVRYHFQNAFFISKRIQKNARIRLVVRPLYEAAWQRNYGSGKNISEETAADATPVTIQLFTGNKHQSSIGLPYQTIN